MRLNCNVQVFRSVGRTRRASRWGDVTAVDMLEGVAVADTGRWWPLFPCIHSQQERAGAHSH
jgi:hypothetical protein